MSLASCRWLGLFVGLVICSDPVARAADFTFHHDHILGTSLEVQVATDSEQAAELAEQKILAEIARQEKIFSSYSTASELSRWQQTKNSAEKISPELLKVMQASAEWQTRSRGAFNPATEAITRVWKRAAERNSLPETAELLMAVKLASATHWELDVKQSHATYLSAAPLSFNAIAKGYIIEAACNVALKDNNDIRGLVVNLGGDLRVCGDAVQRIAIADPANAAENAAPLTAIFVRNRAVATSGNYRRGFQIGGQWYSHIIDPRNGQPVEQLASATVVAKSSADADALATICNILPPNESVALVELHGAQCLIVDRSGQQFESAGWQELTQPQLFRFVAVQGEEKKDAKDEAKEAGELLELFVKIELSRPAGAQYRRPYVAIWLEDADEFPVRTGLLFMMTKEPGPRWHRELNRWYRQDNVRRLADEKKLIGVISSASRGPGEYEAVFDGKDDHGKPLKPGKYTLFVEVAREHGTYQIIRQPLELGAKPIEATNLKTNVEIKSGSFEYRKPAEKKLAK